MSTPRALYVIDPELHPSELTQVPRGASTTTFFNPLQDAHLESTGPVHATSAELRIWFDHLYEVLVDARHAGVARAPVAGLDDHEIDFGTVLEVGFATELHVCVASHLHTVSEQRAVVLAKRPLFAEVASNFLRGRGVPVDVVQLRSASAPAAPLRIGAGRIRDVASMVANWARSDLRVFGASHRQTSPVLQELAANGVATATPTLKSVVDLGARYIATPRAADLEPAAAAVTRLRRFGDQRLEGGLALAWHSWLDMFERRLPTTIEQIGRWLISLDVLVPDLIVAPAWGGVDAHSMRSWCRSRGVPFAVVQHGFGIGARTCVRTGSIDGDIFYAWSPAFVRDWFDPEFARGVEVIGSGNPAYNPYQTRQENSSVETVMLAPAGALDFSRSGVLDFWNSAFQTVESLEDADLSWKLRSHSYGRNDDWIRARGEELGCMWSRDSEPGIDEALAGVDILVTMVSSIAIDAMVRGILVVVTNHQADEPLYLPDTVGAYTTDRNELPQILRRLVESSDARAEAYARQQVVVDNYPTGGAARAAAEHIVSTLT